MTNPQQFQQTLNKKLQENKPKTTVKPYDGTGMLSPASTDNGLSDDDSTATSDTLQSTKDAASTIGMTPSTASTFATPKVAPKTRSTCCSSTYRSSCGRRC